MLCILRGLSRCVGVEKCRGSWKYDRSVLCSRQVRSGAEVSYSYAKNCWLGGWLIGCAGILDPSKDVRQYLSRHCVSVATACPSWRMAHE